MPLSPESAPERGEQSPGTPEPASKRRRLIGLCFAILAFDIGLFLVVFPWSDYWSFNSIQSYWPALEDVWEDPHFKGALTGLGLVNIYVALLEFVRSLRRQG